MIRAGSIEQLKKEEGTDINEMNTKMPEKVLVNCYNRGCGLKFDPNDNEDESCVYHPGTPVFHDAYKGWSCCNKKCTDFTEFLNIKGCTKSYHSDAHPAEPEKPLVDKLNAHEVIEVRCQPVDNEPKLERPSFNTACVLLKPTISPTLLEQIKGLSVSLQSNFDSSKVIIGQSCKNKSCKATYKGPESNDEICYYHPGEPVFHEGLKFWSCCQKRTTDFSAFLEQPGCFEGEHLWISTDTSKNLNCRLDWHQTSSFVFISIYAKKYDPSQSSIMLNPIRLMVDLCFLEENSRYNLDIQLTGIADIEESSVSMLPTKVEIKLKKKEPGSWTKLEISRTKASGPKECENNSIIAKVDAVDLSDL